MIEKDEFHDLLYDKIEMEKQPDGKGNKAESFDQLLPRSGAVLDTTPQCEIGEGR